MKDRILKHLDAPTPWTVKCTDAAVIHACNGFVVAEFEKEERQLAQYIVLCVNRHDCLMDQLAEYGKFGTMAMDTYLILKEEIYTKMAKDYNYCIKEEV